MVRTTVPQKQPTLSPERAFKALTQQLDTLQQLKNRNCQEADPDKTQWEYLTQSIIESAFGDPSSELDRFHGARWAGEHNMMGISPQQQQRNFDLVLQQFDSLLRALIDALRLHLPEEEIKGLYEPGEEYAFYRDLSSLILSATQDIFIVDAYLDEQLFNLYVGKVSDTATVRVLSNRIGPNVETVARMYAKSRPLQMRSSADVHDREVFIDQRGWVIGQSIKDAARKKPTYMIELNEPLLTVTKNVYNGIWAAATVII